MIVLLVLWLLFLFIAVQYLRQEPDQNTNQRISQVLRDLQSLHRQREEISKLLSEYNSANAPMKQEEKEALLKSIQEKVIQPEGLVGSDGNDRDDPPSLEYEKTRRRVRMGVEEMWFFVSNQIRNIQKKAQNVSPQITSQLSKILDEGVEHKRSLIRDVNRLSEVDGFHSWRLKEAVALSDLVQRRLSYLQNPSDCDNAKKLVCKLNKGCGYGCQLHHAVYCMMVAYGTQRTMILQSKGWRYNKGGWETVFRPVSESCTDVSGPVQSWPGNENTPAVLLGIIDSLSPRPPYLPLAVPKDLANRIAKLHGDPAVWWVGQFLKYLMRPQPGTTLMLRDAAVKFKYERPIVGVHIRRTDKVGTEAAFHPVDEYMMHVEEYFKQIELTQKVEKKRIYLASDDVKVFKEVVSK
ncbi:hypothetical protein GE061_019534 [Apolygus lucorum]|uniref:Uncharacterized protein n=1 Tax=Apolygus lucorum TaxID=248454 RepID=A0A6A4JSH6_APOLU|nr:hypothetical protein GE061_019534 [Apolygus lucorum]